MGDSDCNNFAKTICSICYEDLKPIVEDLQSITICGHVFHELCLQQWFEYSKRTKKYTCPVCKQNCKEKDAGRLYFQSVGDSATATQRPIDKCGEEDPEALRREVKRLENTTVGLRSAFELQEKELKELKEEFFQCQKEIKKEVGLKNEVLKQKASLHQQLHMKSEALDTSTLECMRLQERNMALAKELAAFKLVSDLDMDEHEVLKLATLGNGANTKDTIDILRKSLQMSKRSYKELINKYNDLVREARESKKVEREAKEKLKKLKTRVQELETTIELKDNEVLRALKASKKTRGEGNMQNGVKCNSNSMFVNNAPMDGSSAPADASKVPTAMRGLSNPNLKEQTYEDVANQKCIRLKSEAASDAQKETSVLGRINQVEPFSSITDTCNSTAKSSTADMADVVILDDVEPMFNIRKETSIPSPVPRPGDVCFSGGLLGPDGTNRYLGKWCKRGLSNGSETRQTSSPDTGNLIAVGADGRGGRVKLLRSLNQSTVDSKENSPAPKRCKLGGKTNTLQSQGCLQIEHFFGRAGK